MRFELEPEEIQQIVAGVIAGIRPLLKNKDAHTDDTILDVSELCKYLHVTPKWIRERTHLKEIPYYKLSNKQLRFRKKDIDKWLDSLNTPFLSEYVGCSKATLKIAHNG